MVKHLRDHAWCIFCGEWMIGRIFQLSQHFWQTCRTRLDVPSGRPNPLLANQKPSRTAKNIHNVSKGLALQYFFSLHHLCVRFCYLPFHCCGRNSRPEKNSEACYWCPRDSATRDQTLISDFNKNDRACHYPNLFIAHISFLSFCEALQDLSTPETNVVGTLAEYCLTVVLQHCSAWVPWPSQWSSISLERCPASKVVVFGMGQDSAPQNLIFEKQPRFVGFVGLQVSSNLILRLKTLDTFVNLEVR